MKFVLLSDIHATNKIPVGRLDNIFETFKQKFSFVLNYAKKNNCVILQAGDLSDLSRNWNILDYYIENLIDVCFFSVYGQHDLYNRSDPPNTPTTLLELAKSKAVITLGKKPVRIKNTNIYGANWKDSIPIPTNTSVKNILVLHASISKKAEWDGHDFTHPRYFLKKHNRFDLILVGDIHKEFCINQNNKWIINTGPMLRLEANKYNFSHKPCFYIWDSRTLKTKRIQIPHEPAEIVLTRDHIEEKKLNQEELDAFASSLKNMRSITNIREKKIKEYLRSKIKDQKVSEIVLKIMENTNEHRKQN